MSPLVQVKAKVKDFDKHASELAHKSTDIELWRKTLETTWEKVGSAFPSVDAFLRLAGCFTCEKWFDFSNEMKSESHMKDFLKSIDASVHSPEQWVSALDVVENWLSQNRRETSIEHRIGYLACCAEAASFSHLGSDLPEVTKEMLSAHGLD